MAITLKHLQAHQSLEAMTLENFKPFLLNIAGEELLCERILRLLPGKRMVVAGVWQQKKVVAKLFFNGKHASIHLDREMRGYQLLQEQQFKLPPVIFAGETAAPEVLVAIYLELYPLKKLGQVIVKDSAAELERWLYAIQAVIAQLHTVGLMQQDIHPENFLIVSDDVYLVDFSSIRQTNNKAAQLKNLALFYAQLPIQLQAIIPTLFAKYCELRDWLLDNRLEKELFVLIEQSRWWRGQKWLAKCLRTSTDFVAEISWQKAFAYQRHAASTELDTFIRQPEEFIAKHQVALLKDGNTCSVFKISMNNQLYVIKRYNIKNAWHFLTRCKRRTRALKSWCNANLLKLFNVPTAAPIAFVEKRMAGFRSTSYFMMEYVGDKVLADRFATGVDANLVEQTVKLLNELASLHISHGDLKATNFIVSEKNKVYLVDLDAMVFHHKTKSFEHAWHKDIARFRRNWFRAPEVLKAFDIALHGE